MEVGGWKLSGRALWTSSVKLVNCRSKTTQRMSCAGKEKGRGGMGGAFQREERRLLGSIEAPRDETVNLNR